MSYNELITGVISTEEKPVIFSVPKGEFSFSFLTDTIYKFDSSNDVTKIRPKDKFIFGRTHDNRMIAIYYGKDPFPIITSGYLTTSTFILFSQAIKDTDPLDYDIIKFRGKILSQVTNSHILQDKPIHYRIKTKEFEFEMSIFYCGVESNYSIINDKVIIELRFYKSQPVLDCYIHYNKIIEIISFLMYRKSIQFEKIELCRIDPELSKFTNTEMSISIGEVFVNEKGEDSQKYHSNNICFEDLGDALPNLIRLFYDMEERKPSYSLGFIPETDKQRNIINNMKIKEICTALECEFSFQEQLVSDQNPILSKLIEETKKTIKQYRKNNPGINEETYSLIFGNINNWGFSANEKFFKMFEGFKEEICLLNPYFNIIQNKDIQEVIKYRNDITHGSHRILNQKIGITAQAMASLVYCYLLSRIGLSKEQIKELCLNNKLLQ